jgi:hypothetical protein
MIINMAVKIKYSGIILEFEVSHNVLEFTCDICKRIIYKDTIFILKYTL